MNLNLSKLLAPSFLAVLLLGCSPKVSSSSSLNSAFIEPIKQRLEKSEEIGEFIENIEARSKTYLYSPQNVVNCSGMSGNGGFNHLHSSLNPRETMTLLKNDTLDLIFPHVVNLGRMYIWNYNSFKYLDSSIIKFQVEYSLDEINYFPFAANSYNLSLNSGYNDSMHSLINEEDYLDLKGLSVKSLRLKLVNNGGLYYGLSEIRIYKYQKEIQEGNELGASLLVNKKQYTSSKEHYLTSSINLSGYDFNATSSNKKELQYKSFKKEFIFSFDGNYPLGKVGIWNYNDKDDLDSGVKSFELYYSLNGFNYEKIGSYEMERAKGTSEEKVSLVIDLNNLNAEFIKIKYLDNYGGEGYGISGLKFFLGKGRVTRESINYSSLFSNYNGWSGADGIYGVNLKGEQKIGVKEKTFFNFSDTYIGSVDAVSKNRNGYIFKNNSFAYYQNSQIEFIVDSENIGVSKMEERSSSEAFAWLGDAFVSQGKYYLSRHYIAKEGVLGFEQKGEDLLAFDIKDDKVDFDSKRELIDKDTNKLSYFSKDKTIIFGSAFFENTKEAGAINPDGYIYNYGYMDYESNRHLVVLKVKQTEVEDFSKYLYLTNEGWINDISKCKPIGSNVSCELSVTQINNPDSELYGNYLLTYQKDTIGNEIVMAIASSLDSEFTNPTTIYACKEKLVLDNVSFYNAKMHPTLSSNDNYVISYNLNESGGNLNAVNGDIYHPRFLNLFYI